MSNRQQGSISAFVVCSLFGITALTGLVFDGGRVVDAYANMSDVAENAARIGCQQIAGIRAGNIYVDNTNASQRVANYLRAKDLDGEIEVQNGGVRVTVRKVIPMKLLSLTGRGGRTVTVTRSAHVVSG